MDYEHVQHGYFGVGSVALMVIAGVFSLPEMFAESTMGGWVLAGSLMAIAVLVGGNVNASFGLGWPRKSIDLSDVVRVAAVRNTWIQGWGVRKISGGWMYNVWGLDSVEFEMTSGELARIGTNDSDNFLASVGVYTG
jgi:hypothetical protein